MGNIFSANWDSNQGTVMSKLRVLAVLLVALSCVSSWAEAAVLSVSSPDVESGEKSIELGMSWESKDAREYVMELGYSPTTFWNSAIALTLEQDASRRTKYAATSFKNTLQFLRQSDDMPLSAALRLQYEVAHLDGNADDIAMRLLLRHQNDVVDTRLNFGVEHEVGSQSNNVWEGDIRGSIRYKAPYGLRPALDYLGDTKSLHNIRDFDAQDHRIGPVLYYSYGAMSYEIGYLRGISDRAPANTVKFAVGYSF